MIIINKEIVEKSKLTVEQLLVLNSVSVNTCFSATLKELTEKGLIYKDNNLYKLTLVGQTLLENLYVIHKEAKNIDDRVMYLATELKKIFPEGKKEGVNMYWAEGKILIARRLKTFFSKYGYDYTNENILSAARRYVESFNGNYRLMQLLKYFIFKNKTTNEGWIEYESQLVNFMENANQEINIKNDWTSGLQ
jgi:predicted transcriptional regulator